MQEKASAFLFLSVLLWHVSKLNNTVLPSISQQIPQVEAMELNGRADKKVKKKPTTRLEIKSLLKVERKGWKCHIAMRC